MKNILYIFVSLFIITSCESFLEETPVNIITTDQVIVDAESAETAVLGIYSRLQIGDGGYGNHNINLPGVASDEMVHSGSFPTIAEIDDNSMSSNNATTDEIWEEHYTGIFQSNNVLEILDQNPDLPGFTEGSRATIIGQARFLRALFHFNLVNMYGDVPLATTTDLETLSSISRTNSSEVISFVISEARQAASELENAELGNDVQYRANFWAAKALEARALLYSGDVSAAGSVANEIIESGEFSLADNYSDLFQPGSVTNDEIIFSIFFSNADQNGNAFQHLPSGRFEYAVSPQLQAALFADENDSRADLIALNEGDALGRYHFNKYTDIGTGTDGVIVFRLAEMYLIRAEANLGTAAAVADINTLRARAGAAPISNATLDAVLNERFVELYAEGHRWFDLIRTNNAVPVMSGINSGFTIDDTLFPVPNRDILQNPNLSQNSGY
ncbi:RagB/SusD family nutrient uptake outer membrane protein [Marivirga arenosa]|uniref:RagB/SusD family nutrient uptake outer membrane protein n=1 Tax=Marivirga arenosa TaxID=3059076 RepID=A0AA51RDN8_9BACT|nr:RagB/SusD family nutrient uptake outer membrane protein [Marivirga sp. ABR2-2]WMN07490.1 RagB/SusD family nutrient uptake outer membrane protein [Marivirga sp. ABR2-2]